MTEQFPLIVKRLNSNAVLLKRGSNGAAGYDLAAAEPGLVPARGKGLIKTGLAFALPPETCGKIQPRSGLAWKNSIDVGAGVIDEDYRGEVGVVLFNHSDIDFIVNVGDRVAQLVIQRIALPEVVEIEGDLPTTQRGAGGFGSTGVSTGLESPSKKRKVDSVAKTKYTVCWFQNDGSDTSEDIKAFVNRQFVQHGKPEEGMDWRYTDGRPSIYVLREQAPTSAELDELERSLRARGFSTYGGML